MSTTTRTIIVHKAQAQIDPITDVRIEVVGEVPSFEGSDCLEQVTTLFDAQARQIEAALHDSLPGGTYDRLVGYLLARKATHFRVRHELSPRDATVRELLVAAKFAESVLRAQGMFDLSERLAVNTLEKAIAKLEGLDKEANDG